MARRSLLILAVPLFAGCYTYRSGELSSFQVGTSVRARLSAGGAQRLERLLGPLDNQSIDGTVLENSRGTLRLETIYGHYDERATNNAQRHAFVELTEQDWLSLEHGKISVVRTAGLIGLIGGGLKFVYNFYKRSSCPAERAGC